MYSAVNAARSMAISENRPILIEVKQGYFFGIVLPCEREILGLISNLSFSLILFLLPLQALTYRVGHHSTSDDSTKYRSNEEIEWFKLARDPVTRFRKWIENRGWWNGELESELRNSVKEEVTLNLY